MHPLVRIAKRIVPSVAWTTAAGYYHAWNRVAEWYLNRKYWASVDRLLKLKDKHQGERCVIIGNGPSLQKTDTSLLKDEITFGMNRVYIAFDDWGFSTTYYVAVNKLVVEHFAHDIARLPMPKFISWDSLDLIDFMPDMIFLKSLHDPGFFTDVTQGIWQGATVTYAAMQLAYYMGFQQVILIGVDHSFSTQGEPNKTVVSEGDDPNHFDSRYFGKGYRWQLPDLVTSELAYRLARYQFELAGREIIDATIDGKLEVFPKADYHTLFADSGEG